jgi:N-acyl-D-amino-acid deacylase
VIDGTGRARFDADVLIDGDRIAQIGPGIMARGAAEYDARGMVVSPGFVDIHSHGDGSLFRDPMAESVIRQGLTTIVVGQDGSSRGPREQGDSAERFTSIGGYMAALEREVRPATNVATMVGLGTVRGNVVGAANRPATADEIRRMTALVEQALAEGACGASTGLEYAPGAFASTEELIALCRPLAARQLPYATHMRNEDDTLVEAVDESIAVARGAGCPLQISHLKTSGARNFHKIDDVFAHIEAARRSGLEVTFDRYPYVAYSTGLSNMFPVWALDGGSAAFVARLTDPATAARVRTESEAKADTVGGWKNVVVSGVSNDADRGAEGRRIDELAAAASIAPYEYAVGLLTRNRGDVGTVVFAMSEDNLRRFLAHPLGMVCSDGGAFAISGPARSGHPHPRGLGTFPRVLSRYVRESGTLTLEQAVNKMTGMPAARLRLADIGTLRAGRAADVVVFDPATVEDKATFSEPFQYPVGIRLVVVNGEIALREGERSATRAGRVLRPSAG